MAMAAVVVMAMVVPDDVARPVPSAVLKATAMTYENSICTVRLEPAVLDPT